MAVPFYRYSLETAKSGDDVELYRASIEENRRCKDFVQGEKTGFYAKAYKDNCVDSDGSYTKSLIKEFGMERVLNMYAVTVRNHSGDGRISDEVRDWAKNFNSGLRHNEDMRESLITQINPGVIDLLAKHAIREFDSLNLFTIEHCDKDETNYEDKVVIVSHKSLKEEYWTPENQLWLATGGFGCDPTKIGRAVYATCLIDDDQSRWDRHQVLGVIKDEYLPDWAREKLEEMQAEEQSQNNDINLG